jgi:hypothetical protein
MNLLVKFAWIWLLLVLYTAMVVIAIALCYLCWAVPWCIPIAITFLAIFIVGQFDD